MCSPHRVTAQSCHKNVLGRVTLLFGQQLKQTHCLVTVCVTQSKTNRVVSTRFRAQNSSLLLATVSAVSNLLVGRSRSGTPSVHTEPPRYSTVTTRRGAELTTTPEKSVCVRTERALPEPSTTIDSFLRVAKLVFLVPECFARLSVCVKTCQEECFWRFPLTLLRAQNQVKFHLFRLTCGDNSQLQR